MNRVTLIGRLGQDPEVRYTESGKAVANFSLATSEGRSDNQRTEWHRIVCWEKTAELVGQYLNKGRQVCVEGRIQTRKWTDKEGTEKYTTEIVAYSVEFLGSKADSPAPAPAADHSDDGTIPF